MASSVIHMAVANEVNKTLNRDNDKILLGSISPDISKLVGDTKKKSHFLIDDTDIPNIDLFLNIYKDHLDDDFVMGYFIHLYTDYLWFRYFVPEVLNTHENLITKLDGTFVKCNGKTATLYIYNDYTNLNGDLIEKYNLDVKTLFNKRLELKNIILEIPMDKLNVLTDKIMDIIENAKVHKDFIFNLDNIIKFISTSTELILAKIKEIGDN